MIRGIWRWLTVEGGAKVAGSLGFLLCAALWFAIVDPVLSQEKSGGQSSSRTLADRGPTQPTEEDKHPNGNVAAPHACHGGPGAADFQLKAGISYENLRAWKEAEERYLAAGGDTCSSKGTRKLAIEGIERVRARQIAEAHVGERFDYWGRAVDSLGGWLVRGFVLAVVLSIFWIAALRIPDAWGAVEVARFVTPADKKLASQIESSFVKARAKLLNTSSPYLGARRQITIPIDPGVLSDLSFEAGGFKLAGLASLWRLFFPPLFRITGGGHIGTGSITFHAQIWQRWGWFGSRLRETVIVEVPSPHGLDIVQLENFIYAIFLRVLYASR
jgi:hypothetical protein